MSSAGLVFSPIRELSDSMFWGGDSKLCYITVVFPDFGFPLHYYADTAVAHACATAIERMGLARVSVDQQSDDTARPLPCQGLWVP